MKILELEFVRPSICKLLIQLGSQYTKGNKFEFFYLNLIRLPFYHFLKMEKTSIRLDEFVTKK